MAFGVLVLSTAVLVGCTDDGGNDPATPSTTTTMSSPTASDVVTVDPEGDLAGYVGRRVQVTGTVDRVFAPNVFNVIRQMDGDGTATVTSSPTATTGTATSTTSPGGTSPELRGVVLLYNGEAEITEGVLVTATGEVRESAAADASAQEMGLTLPRRLLPTIGAEHFVRVDELQTTPATTGGTTPTTTS
jgi:hypothetical protein